MLTYEHIRLPVDPINPRDDWFRGEQIGWEALGALPTSEVQLEEVPQTVAGEAAKVRIDEITARAIAQATTASYSQL